MKLLNKIILVLCLFLLGADTPTLISYPPEKIMGFRGLDKTSTAPMIADSRASDLLNVKLSSAMDLQKRYGMDVVNDNHLDDLDLNFPAINGLFDAEYSNGNSWTLAFVGSKLKYDNSGTWSTCNIYGITDNDEYKWGCVMAYDYAVCTNNYDPPLKVNSTPVKSTLSFTGLSNAVTKAKAVVFFRNYLIWGNTYENGTERPTRFRWSDVGTIETYQDDNFTDIASLAGDEIVGFAEMYGDLYIFLKKAIWRASLVGGDDVFAFDKVIDGIGAIARDSIQIVQLPDNRMAIAFLDERKRVLMFNGVTVTDIGALIQDELDELNEGKLKNAVATFDGENYYLSVSYGSSTTNDYVYVFNTSIFEWTKYDQIDANVFAQVKETTGAIKTYVGNYDSFVYWLDNPDLYNDIDGTSGTVDSVGRIAYNSFATGLTMLIDSNIASGGYTGAIVRITSGTGVGQESIIASTTTTGVILANTMSTSPDSTSVYSIGAIDAYYTSKAYDMGDSAREKAYMGLLLWAAEQSSAALDISYGVDYGDLTNTTTKSLAPLAESVWDTALWDTGIWGSVGDKITTVKMKGFGNAIQLKFANDSADETFHLYGFNILGTAQDIKQ